MPFLLIARSPRLSSATLEKAAPFPAKWAGLGLALFERGKLEREVDMLLMWAHQLPAGHVAFGAAHPFLFPFRTKRPGCIHGNRYLTPILDRGCLTIVKLFTR